MTSNFNPPPGADYISSEYLFTLQMHLHSGSRVVCIVRDVLYKLSLYLTDRKKNTNLPPE